MFDEINLAPANVLQCIQQSLDNGFLSVETNGRCLLKFEKNPNFALVATQNPNKGAFAGKRQELGPEFLSRFQKIYFPDILIEEMEKIALGIAKNVEYLIPGEKDEKYKELLIKDIVNLHFDWAKETDSQADIQCFTIREIESVIECLKNREDPYNVIMTIYGGRFRQNRKDKLKLRLQKYDTLKILREDNKPLPSNFPQCFVNDSLVQTVKSVLLALRNNVETKKLQIKSGDNVKKIIVKFDCNVTSMNGLFRDKKYIKSVNFIKFNRTNIDNMSCLFKGCWSLNEINFTNFKTNNVYYMSSMFDECRLLKKIDLSNFNTSNVVGMDSMFKGCSILKEINVNKFNTINVTNMSSMFNGLF